MKGARAGLRFAEGGAGSPRYASWGGWVEAEAAERPEAPRRVRPTWAHPKDGSGSGKLWVLKDEPGAAANFETRTEALANSRVVADGTRTLAQRLATKDYAGCLAPLKVVSPSHVAEFLNAFASCDTQTFFDDFLSVENVFEQRWGSNAARDNTVQHLTCQEYLWISFALDHCESSLGVSAIRCKQLATAAYLQYCNSVLSEDFTKGLETLSPRSAGKAAAFCSAHGQTGDAGDVQAVPGTFKKILSETRLSADLSERRLHVTPVVTDVVALLPPVDIESILLAVSSSSSRTDDNMHPFLPLHVVTNSFLTHLLNPPGARFLTPYATASILSYLAVLPISCASALLPFRASILRHTRTLFFASHALQKQSGHSDADDGRCLTAIILSLPALNIDVFSDAPLAQLMEKYVFRYLEAVAVLDWLPEFLCVLGRMQATGGKNTTELNVKESSVVEAQRAWVDKEAARKNQNSRTLERLWNLSLESLSMVRLGYTALHCPVKMQASVLMRIASSAPSADDEQLLHLASLTSNHPSSNEIARVAAAEIVQRHPLRDWPLAHRREAVTLARLLDPQATPVRTYAIFVDWFTARVHGMRVQDVTSVRDWLVDISFPLEGFEKAVCQRVPPVLLKEKRYTELLELSDKLSESVRAEFWATAVQVLGKGTAARDRGDTSPANQLIGEAVDTPAAYPGKERIPQPSCNGASARPGRASVNAWIDPEIAVDIASCIDAHGFDCSAILEQAAKQLQDIFKTSGPEAKAAKVPATSSAALTRNTALAIRVLMLTCRASRDQDADTHPAGTEGPHSGENAGDRSVSATMRELFESGFSWLKECGLGGEQLPREYVPVAIEAACVARCPGTLRRFCGEFNAKECDQREYLKILSVLLPELLKENDRLEGVRQVVDQPPEAGDPVLPADGAGWPLEVRREMRRVATEIVEKAGEDVPWLEADGIIACLQGAAALRLATVDLLEAAADEILWRILPDCEPSTLARLASLYTPSASTPRGYMPPGTLFWCIAEEAQHKIDAFSPESLLLLSASLVAADPPGNESVDLFVKTAVTRLHGAALPVEDLSVLAELVALSEEVLPSDAQQLAADGIAARLSALMGTQARAGIDKNGHFRRWLRDASRLAALCDGGRNDHLHLLKGAGGGGPGVPVSDAQAEPQPHRERGDCGLLVRFFASGALSRDDAASGSASWVWDAAIGAAAAPHDAHPPHAGISLDPREIGTDVGSLFGALPPDDEKAVALFLRGASLGTTSRRWLPGSVGGLAACAVRFSSITDARLLSITLRALIRFEGSSGSPTATPQFLFAEGSDGLALAVDPFSPPLIPDTLPAAPGAKAEPRALPTGRGTDTAEGRRERLGRGTEENAAEAGQAKASLLEVVRESRAQAGQLWVGAGVVFTLSPATWAALCASVYRVSEALMRTDPSTVSWLSHRLGSLCAALKTLCAVAADRARGLPLRDEASASLRTLDTVLYHISHRHAPPPSDAPNPQTLAESPLDHHNAGDTDGVAALSMCLLPYALLPEARTGDRNALEVRVYHTLNAAPVDQCVAVLAEMTRVLFRSEAELPAGCVKGVSEEFLGIVLKKFAQRVACESLQSGGVLPLLVLCSEVCRLSGRLESGEGDVVASLLQASLPWFENRFRDDDRCSVHARELLTQVLDAASAHGVALPSSLAADEFSRKFRF
ncbi:hypothetical protein DIPPA_15023 [Diplonema papillatum]|nr:hypothetical protein DIPPA_15023 [Diplonema papillatum]